MNKKILIFSFFVLLFIGGIILKSVDSKNTSIEKQRNQHAEFLKNHPYQKTGNLSKKQRKANGLPPNAYFEQKYLSEINPFTGKTNQENIFKIQQEQEELKKTLNRTAKKIGEATNPWIDRGPNNVGGRTRAIIFDPNDTTNETVFAGGVSGGLWKNTNISNPSSGWTQIGIPENLAVSSITVDPNNSKIFYVGTGESYTGGEANGNGLWKSSDGGNSWIKIFGGATGETFFDSNSKLTVNAPADIAGDYTSVVSTNFGASLGAEVTGDLALVNDGTDTTEDACEAITNAVEINGKIAIIRRGGCTFVDKVLKAQNAGAIAAVIINNLNTNPFNMSGDDATITIPAIMVTKKTGETLLASLAGETVNLTLSQTGDSAPNSDAVPGIQYINDIAIRNNSGVSEIFIAVGDTSSDGTNLGGNSIGIYKSVDGINFSKIDTPKTSNGNNYAPNNIEIAGNKDIYFSTTNSRIYGDGGGAIFKSSDGTNFTLLHTVDKGARTEIAVSKTTSGVVYVLSEITDRDNPVKIFRTTDDFVTVTQVSLPNDADTGISENDFTRGQAFYDLLLKVDPTNDDVLYVGGIDLFKSTTAGNSWEQLSHWYGGFGFQEVHADQHGVAFASSSRMVFSNDGGVYFSDNAGTTISSRNINYNTVQFYTVGVAPTTAFDGDEYFIAGAQDNGTLLFSDANEGANNATQAQGGDGAYSFFDTDGTDKYSISNYVYNNSINLFNYVSNSSLTINEESPQNGDFINQEELDSNKNILYSNYSSGSDYIIKRYSGLLSGLITKDNLTNDLMNSGPSAMKVSPYTSESSKLFVGLKNSKLLVIEKADTDSASWYDITGSEFIGSISDIEFGTNESEIFVTMHNYGVNSIWFTDDAGATWKNKEGDFPDIPVKAILQNPLNLNEVIIGTQLGVWKTSDFNVDAPKWVQSHNGMSSVPVLDLDLRDDNTVFAATYGRGVFSAKFTLNPKGDNDKDGILNSVDNCPSVANADQADSNGNGIGDVCEDTDGDGIADAMDNCPSVSNPDQADSDVNGIGDVCQDTDADGITDSADNCPTTANPDQLDRNFNGIGDVCDTSYKAHDNISIQTTSETCTNQNDGKITVNIKQTFVDYTITLKGEGKDKIEKLSTKSFTFQNLKPATYEVCVVVDGRNYKQCFELNILKANPVSLKIAKNSQSKNYTVHVNSGTAPYSVYLNGNLLNSFDSSTFDLNFKGSGMLEVKTSKPCEGAFKTVINNIFLKKNPVSNSIDLMLPITNTSNIDIIIFDITGKTVLQKTMQKQRNSLSIPFDSFKAGIYVLKVGGADKNNTFKIIKK